MTLTVDILPAVVAAWQRLLRLQDWDLVVRIVRTRDMADASSAGECVVRGAKRSALIRLLDPLDYDPDWIRPLDMERTLLHELLHLHTHDCGLKLDTPEQRAEERAIEAVASALLRLARGAGVQS